MLNPTDYAESFMVYQTAMDDYSQKMMNLHNGTTPNTEEARLELHEARKKVTFIMMEALEDYIRYNKLTK